MFYFARAHRHRTLREWAVLALVVCLMNYAAFVAWAMGQESANYRITASTVGSGGILVQSGTYMLPGSVGGEPFYGDTESFNYIVRPGYLHMVAANAPVLEYTIPSYHWQKGTSLIDALTLTNHFTHPDDATMEFSVTGNLDINVDITGASGTVSFSQDPSFAGMEKVVFIATDGDNLKGYSNVVSLLVYDPAANDPPMLDFLPDLWVNEGDLVTVSPYAYDADGDPVTYTFTYPLASNGTWQTGYGDGGTYDVTVTASDGTLTDSREFRITVNDVNRPPVLDPLDPITVNEGEVVQVYPSATDPDGDPIIFSYQAPLDSNGRWETDYDDGGSYLLTVTASDGRETDSETVSITVNEVDTVPTIDLTVNPNTVDTSVTVNIRVTASDEDGDSLTLTLAKDSEPPLYTGPISGIYDTTTSFSAAGDHIISATVEDADANIVTASAYVDVNDPSENHDKNAPLAGDFNGDGFVDAGYHNSANGKWRVSLNDGGVLEACHTWLTGFADSDTWKNVGGDFNGDGYADIGAWYETDGTVKIGLSTGSSFEAPPVWGTLPSGSDKRILSGDFNADGWSDVGVYDVSNGNCDIALSNGSSFGSSSTWISSFGGSSEWYPVVGDFNGDGLTDLGRFQYTSGNWYVALSDGSQFTDSTQWISSFATSQSKVFVADFNDDGLADIGYWSGGSWYQALSRGTSFESDGTWLSFGSGDISPMTADFNGDGLSDAVTFDKTKNGVAMWAKRTSHGGAPDLLVRMENGTGGKTEITYTPSTRTEDCRLPFVVQVVTRVASVDMLPVSEPVERYQQYTSYAGGRCDREEREFRGFGKTTVTDPISGNSAVSYFYQGVEDAIVDNASDEFKAQVARVSAYDGDGNILSDTLNTYEATIGGASPNNVYFVRMDETESTVWERGESLSVRNSFVYDNLGNITEEINEGDLSVAGDEKFTYLEYSRAYLYDATAGEGFNRAVHTWMLNSASDTVEQKWFVYDSRGNLTRQENFLDGEVNPVTQFQYDGYGNTTVVTNALGHDVTTTYDSTYHALPVQMSNELGHTIGYDYDYGYGLVTAITDANGQTTSTVYDTLGRKIEERNADGALVTEYLYPDFNTAVTQQVVGTSVLSSTEYADGLGRTYRTLSSGEDGDNLRPVETTKGFDNRGRVEWESLPHYIGEDPDQITYLRYTYDSRGRVIQVDSDFPGTIKDSFATTEYVSPLVTTARDALGHRKTSVKDVYDNVREIIEHTERGDYLTQYEYDIEGNLIQVTDAQGNETHIEYDTLGWKTSLDDPDTGVTTYTYDSMGNLLNQTDAKGQVVSFVYDALCRVVSKQVDSGTGAVDVASYSYDDPGTSYGTGRLCGVTDESGLTTMEYDKEGRIVQTARGIDGATYEFSTSYDILGRVTENVYPEVAGATETVHYAYDVHSGLLESATGNVAYATGLVYSEKGQLLEQTFGNGTTTGYDYGLDQLLSRMSVTSGPSTIQDLRYTFDKAGNITRILDLVRGYDKNYAYDDLNRLVHATGIPDGEGGVQSEHYAYDAIGNILWKTGVGWYTYGENGAGPHAVTTAGTDTYTYDANGNMTGGAARSMTWDALNQLASVTKDGDTSTFVYNHSGDRVKKTTPDEVDTYVGSLFEIRDTTASGGMATYVMHIFAGDNRICTVEQEETGPAEYYYYHSDHLGSSNLVTDETGSVVEHLEYAPFGTTTINEGSYDVVHKFTGKELDASTGLYYYGARYYDAHLGRFISADSIVQAPMDPQSLNRYSYCRNNPLVYTDPSGSFWWIIFIISAIIGAVVGGISAAQSGGNIIAGILGGAAISAVAFIAASFVAPIAEAFGSAVFQTTFPVLGGPIAGAIGTAAEFAVTGFVSALASGLVTGDMRGAIRSAGISAAINAVIGGIVGYTRFAGIQKEWHGLDPEEEFAKAARSAIERTDTDALTEIQKGMKQAAGVGDGLNKNVVAIVNKKRSIEASNKRAHLARIRMYERGRQQRLNSAAWRAANADAAGRAFFSTIESAVKTMVTRNMKAMACDIVKAWLKYRFVERPRNDEAYQRREGKIEHQYPWKDIMKDLR